MLYVMDEKEQGRGGKLKSISKHTSLALTLRMHVFVKLEISSDK